MNHATQTANHRPYAAVYADAAARSAATGFLRGEGGALVAFDAADLYKVVLQLSPFSEWALVDVSPLTWEQLSGAGAAPLAVRTETATYSVAVTDDVVMGNSATAITFNLPPGASRGVGIPYYFGNINDGTLSLNPDGSEQIDGEATLDLGPRDKVMAVWTGSAWETW